MQTDTSGVWTIWLWLPSERPDIWAYAESGEEVNYWVGQYQWVESVFYRYSETIVLEGARAMAGVVAAAIVIIDLF